MKKFLFSFLLLVSCTGVISDKDIQDDTVLKNTPNDIDGYDVIALAKYCDVYLKAPVLPAVSTLLSTFGNPLPCIAKRIERGGIILVQIDLIDATCWRNNVCPPGAPRPDDLKEIEKRAKLVSTYAQKYPLVKWEISPALEHDVKSVTRVRQMLQAAKKGCPKCAIINSPFTGATPNEYPIERHGTRIKAHSISADGQSSFDGDNISSDGNNFVHTDAGSFSTYTWVPEFNLRCTGEDAFVPPNLRTEKPTFSLLRQAYQLNFPEEPKPVAPLRCKTVREVKSPEIVKTNAESYCNRQPENLKNDKRNNKPLLIIKKKGSPGQKLKVYSKEGKEVACFLYYGPFSEPGLYRWYMGNCSGETPYKLFTELKSEWGYTDLGNGNCLLINSIRRMGRYR